jgi:hypothetical protein
MCAQLDAARSVLSSMPTHTDPAGSALDFERDILPRSANRSLAVVMEMTGLSRRYCWLIKTGQTVPHQRHWQALSALVTSTSTAR